MFPLPAGSTTHAEPHYVPRTEPGGNLALTEKGDGSCKGREKGVSNQLELKNIVSRSYFSSTD